jgi:putative spermidine/putrescine transport system substrate-binding protein
MFRTALFAALLIGATEHSYADSQVVMATWGGFVGQLFKDSMADPFAKKTGVTVDMLAGMSLSNYQRMMAERKHPQIDVITLTSTDAQRAYDQGLTEGLDPKEIPNLKVGKDVGIHLDAKGLAPFGPLYMYPYGIIYRTDKVPFPITKWTDLWDPRLKNKVGVNSPRFMLGYFLLSINRIAGGNEADIRPGIAKIKSLGPNLVAVLDDDNSQVQALTDGEIWVEPSMESHAAKIIGDGVPAKFVFPADGTPAGMDVIALVKGAPHRKEALAFINYALSLEALGKLDSGMKVTPTNPDVQLTPEAAKFAVTDAQRKQLIFFDDGAITRNRAQWLETWDREIAPMIAR